MNNQDNNNQAGNRVDRGVGQQTVGKKYGDEFILRGPEGLKGRAVKASRKRNQKLSPWLVDAIAIEADAINPRIDPGHWMGLPAPFLQMQGRRVEIYTTDTNRSVKGMFSIDRHPTNDELFSVVIIINNLDTGSPYSIAQMRCRVAPGDAKWFRRDLPDGKYEYRIEVAEKRLSDTPLPRQFVGD